MGVFEVSRASLEIQIDRNSGSEISGLEVKISKSLVYSCIHMSKVTLGEQNKGKGKGNKS